jgi:hypothetical protein
MADTNEQIVELIRFTTTGVDDAAAVINKYKDVLDDTIARGKVLTEAAKRGYLAADQNRVAAETRRVERLTAALRNQVYARATMTGQVQKHAAAMTQLDRRMEVMRGRVGVQSLARDVAGGGYGRHAAAVAGITRQRELLTGHAQNQVLEKDLNSGTYARHAKDVAGINKQYEQLQKRAKLQSLVAEHGKWGAVMRANRTDLLGLAGVAMGGYAAVAGTVMGLVRSGEQGSVTGLRLAYSWERLGREVAGIAQPAVNAFASSINAVSSRLEKLPKKDQDALQGIGILAGGGAAAGGLAYGGYKAYRWASNISSTASEASKLPAGVTSSGATIYSSPVAGATEAAGNVAARSGGLLSRLGGAARFVGGKVLAPVGAGLEAYNEFSRFAETGFTGRNVLHFGLQSLPMAGTLREHLDATLAGAGYAGGRRVEAPAPNSPPGARPEGHRTEMAADIYFGESSSSYDRIAAKVLSTTAALASSPNDRDIGQVLAESMTALTEKIGDLLREMTIGNLPKPRGQR